MWQAVGGKELKHRRVRNSDHASSSTPGSNLTFLGVNTEVDESLSEDLISGLVADDGPLRPCNNFDIPICSRIEKCPGPVDALRWERGVDGAAEVRLDNDASEAEGVRGIGDVVVLCSGDFGDLRDERGGGGGGIRDGAEPRRWCCICVEGRREEGISEEWGG